MFSAGNSKRFYKDNEFFNQYFIKKQKRKFSPQKLYFQYPYLSTFLNKNGTLDNLDLIRNNLM